MRVSSLKNDLKSNNERILNCYYFFYYLNDDFIWDCPQRKKNITCTDCNRYLVNMMKRIRRKI